MSRKTRSIVAQAASFLLAGVLLYLALRGVDLNEVLAALEDANYAWLGPLVAIVLLSHLARAWRWRLFIKALPEVKSGEQQVVSTPMAFYSLMIGYMVNYAAPRLGEIARTANLTARSGIAFSSLFGTVVVERVLDVIVLAAGLLSVFLLLFDRAPTIERLFIEPIASQLGPIPALGIAAAIILVAVLVLLIYRQVLRTGDSAFRRFWTGRAVPALTSFKSGLMTLLRSKDRVGLVGSTLVMWFLYLLMAYVPFVMLGMADTYDIGLLDSWSIMLLGSVGVVIPSPGGTGSYHYITIQTLVHLFEVDAAPAATYAVLVHASQLVLYVFMGAFSLMLQGSSVRALHNRTMEAQEKQRSS